MSQAIEIIHHEGTPRVDSRAIAVRLNIQHKNIMENINKYSEQFQVLGQLTFKTEVGKRKQGGGNPKKYALLNEDQCVFLLTLSRNTEQVVQLKLDLTIAFKNARQSVQHAKSPAPILYTSNPWIWQSIKLKIQCIDLMRTIRDDGRSFDLLNAIERHLLELEQYYLN